MKRAWLPLIFVGCAVASGVDPAPFARANAVSDSEPGSQVTRPARCDSDLHRAFDFWIGSWVVETPEGKRAGTNRISSILGGCALREEWRGAGGSEGTSVNAYDASRGVWHQTWVDARGQLLILEGGMHGGAMVLRGETSGEKGKLTHEIAWTRLGDGRVKQHWRSSPDAGQTWTDVFVGLYRRAD